MLTRLLGGLLVLFVGVLASPPALAQDRQYEVGQVWAYEAENAGDDGVLIIQRIERAEDTRWPFDIYHISLIADVQVGEMGELEVGHLPVARETLDISVTELRDREMTQFADWEVGYSEWKSAQGGVFDISLSQIIDFLAGMMTQTNQHGGAH